MYKSNNNRKPIANGFKFWSSFVKKIQYQYFTGVNIGIEFFNGSAFPSSVYAKSHVAMIYKYSTVVACSSEAAGSWCFKFQFRYNNSQKVQRNPTSDDVPHFPSLAATICPHINEIMER